MNSEEMRLIHLATVKPSGSPHVVPMLALFFEGKVYFETGRNSVKVKNILKNNNIVAVTVDSRGNGTIVIEGKARIISDEEVTNHVVAKMFGTKHPWKPTFGKESAYVLVEITPKKIMKV